LGCASQVGSAAPLLAALQNHKLLTGTHTHVFRGSIDGIDRTLKLAGLPKDTGGRCGVLDATGLHWKPAGLMALWQRLFAGRTQVLCCPFAFVNLLLGYFIKGFLLATRGNSKYRGHQLSN
jgi:hypothetical protein